MVAGRHNLTRRALLGAAAGVPLAAFAPLGPGDEKDSSPFALSLAKGCPSLSEPEERAGLRQAQPERDSMGSGNQIPFSRALAAFRRAEARLAAFRRYEASLPAAARAFPACEPLEERFGDLDSARLRALRRLLRASAPDFPALALKIDLAVDNQAWELTGAHPCLAALKADAHRLAAASANSSA